MEINSLIKSFVGQFADKQKLKTYFYTTAFNKIYHFILSLVVLLILFLVFYYLHWGFVFDLLLSLVQLHTVCKELCK